MNNLTWDDLKEVWDGEKNLTDKPIFIDLLSIEKYLPNTFWRGQMQFYYEFLNPLLLKSYFDIDYNNWYKSIYILLWPVR